MESYGNLSCSCWKHLQIKQNLLKSNVSAVVTFQLPLICHNYCHHPIGMIDCSTSPLRQGRRKTKHYHHESPPSRTHDVVETNRFSHRPICFTEHWVGTLATSTLHARIRGGGARGPCPPPPPHKILLPQIVRRGPRGPCPPPPRGPRGPWPPPLQNPGSAYALCLTLPEINDIY